jgi:hypothetical protein
VFLYDDANKSDLEDNFYFIFYFLEKLACKGGLGAYGSIAAKEQHYQTTMHHPNPNRL